MVIVSDACTINVSALAQAIVVNYAPRVWLHSLMTLEALFMFYITGHRAQIGSTIRRPTRVDASLTHK
jgi:hypothetical protein